MGLPELVARLERDADARVAAIDDACRREVEAIEAEARRLEARRTADELANKRSERRARLDRELAEARVRSRKDLLDARRAVLDRVLSRAAALLEHANEDPAYRASLGARLSLALSFVRGPATIRCRPDLDLAVKHALGTSGSATVQTDAGMPAGFVVTSDDGAVEIDDTLGSRLARMGDALAIELLQEVERAR